MSALAPPPIDRLEAVLKAIAGMLPDGIKVRIGSINERAKLDSATRVLFEPFGRRIAAGSGGAEGGTRALFTRIERVRVHIWGATISEAEELEEVLFNLLVQAATWSIEIGEGLWDLPASGQRGVVLTQEFSILIPVIRRQQTAPLTFEPLDTAIESPLDT